MSQRNYRKRFERGSQAPSSFEDSLNLALRIYLKRFSRGAKHDDHKARSLMRKALQLQRKKKELFESARKCLSDSMIAQADENKRTPWQLLLHKGAPGSNLTGEFVSHENAQLVPLPLLKLVASMTSEWKKAHRDIVQGSFQDRNKAARPKCPYEHIHRTCRHSNIALDATFAGEASNPERGRATQDLETLNEDYAIFNIDGEVEPDVQIIHMALAVQDVDKTR